MVISNTRRERERVRTTLIRGEREREGERSHPESGVTYQTGRITYFSPGGINQDLTTDTESREDARRTEVRGVNGKLKL